jgi:prepilin-type N-terminal cleavage/methylation domain-containing protein
MTTPNHKLNTGFTLIEVIIAISVFTFLAIMLAGFIQRGLDLWKTGESRGDTSERGQILMEQIKKDLAGVFNGTDKRTIIVNNFNLSLYVDAQDFIEPSFYAGLDQNGNTWIYFTRLNNDKLYTLDPNASAYKINRERITYRMNTANATPQLIRGVISENTAISFWQQGLEQQNYVPATQSQQAFDDILYLGGIFSGTSSAWDSRIIPPSIPPPGIYLEAPQNIPATVKIIIDVKPMPLNRPKIILTKNLTGNIATINIPRTLLSSGSFIKINNEWLRVQSISTYILSISRAQRNTTIEPHSAGAEVQYGETIENTIILPTALK